MGARIILWLSLAINGALIVLLTRYLPADLPPSPTPGVTKRPDKQSKTRDPKVVVRRLPFTWAQIESEDYRKYIENLRSIGCPEETVRDIIVAEIEHAFEIRKIREVTVPERQWWTDNSDLDQLESVSDQVARLDQEKEVLLTELLGTGWRTPASPVNDFSIFDGPILSKMTEEKKRAVLDIQARTLKRRTQTAADPGAASNPEELVALRAQTRAELAAILSPQELEEYLLRHSYNSNVLREELRGFGANSNEFRAIFKARDPIDQQLLALGDKTDPATTARRNELIRARDEAVSGVLGVERFPLYKMTQDPLFRQAQEQAEMSGRPAEAVLPIYAIHQATQTELARIQLDNSLTDQARTQALDETRRAQEAAIERLLNPQAQAASPPE